MSPFASPVASDPLGLLAQFAEDVLQDGSRRFGDQKRWEEASRLAREALSRAKASQMNSEEARAFLDRLTQVCFLGGWQRVLMKYGLDFPSYNYVEDYATNAAQPWTQPPAIRPATLQRRWTVLGKSVGFPLGVPASPLTANARWIDFLARQGFNILTYKTVRSSVHGPHPAPNWVFVDADRPWPVGESGQLVVGGVEAWPKDRHAFSTANSFGMPSTDPDIWQPDVAAALNVLADDQLLLVSVVGSSQRGQDQVKDFVRVATQAEEAGCSAIELNLSCPNTIDEITGQISHDFICHSATATQVVVEAVRSGLVHRDTKIVVKLAYLDVDTLTTVMTPIAHLVSGVSGINTMQRTVLDHRGEPTFEGRRDAGVSGVAIREHGIDFVRRLAVLRADLDAPFDILGMGGVMTAKDVLQFHGAGADAVLSASAPFVNAGFAGEVIRELGDVLPDEPGGPRTLSGGRKLAPSDTAQVGGINAEAIILALRHSRQQTIEALRRGSRLVGEQFDEALAAATANGLITIRRRMGGDVEAVLTSTGEAVLASVI